MGQVISAGVEHREYWYVGIRIVSWVVWMMSGEASDDNATGGGGCIISAGGRWKEGRTRQREDEDEWKRMRTEDDMS